MLHSFLAASTLAVASAFAPVAQDGKVDPKIPEYKTVDGISGELKTAGSDTMNVVMASWQEGFRALYPNVKTAMKSEGSASAPTALIEGTATFGPMSRSMKKEEIDLFEKKFGYKPTGIPAALDSLAVFVSKDNPLKSLTLQQVDAIFSKTRKGGYEKDIATWGDLGLTGDWASKPISLYGRNSTSGTYGFFKDHVLAKGDFKDTVKEQPGSGGVVQAVASDKYAIGYSGIGYATADVRALPIAVDAKSAPIEPNAAHVYDNTYPIARVLYVYTNYKPDSQLDPLRREFVRYMLSQQGQAAVVKDGFYPLTPRQVETALKSIGQEVKLVEAGASKK
ncbi:MAG: PstS family phosphate ABC transporter substrate-binding protein [Planctomycetes bacterium]|nr:PstS family phosphate ABC transporter substrate-binding protein [Planctomycetota bacterium]